VNGHTVAYYITGYINIISEHIPLNVRFHPHWPYFYRRFWATSHFLTMTRTNSRIPRILPLQHWFQLRQVQLHGWNKKKPPVPFGRGVTVSNGPYIYFMPGKAFYESVSWQTMPQECWALPPVSGEMSCEFLLIGRTAVSHDLNLDELGWIQIEIHNFDPICRLWSCDLFHSLHWLQLWGVFVKTTWLTGVHHLFRALEL